MKRPYSASADSFNGQKILKPLGTQLPGAFSDAVSNTQSVPYIDNAPCAGPAQNQLAAYYMTGSGYYQAMASPDLASNMYSQLGLNAWQMAPATIDTSRPPPPPLPTTPAPENPPLPPLPPQERVGAPIAMTPPTQFYRGRGGHGNYRKVYGEFREDFNRGSNNLPSVASQPPQCGLVVKSPSGLNGQASTSIPTTENAKQHRIMGQTGVTEAEYKQRNCPIVHQKKKRKPMSERRPALEWKLEDAQRVLELEKEYHAKRGNKAIIVKFPDPKLDCEVVKRFSPSIESVHFQQPASPRSCIVHIKKGVDVKKVVEELNRIPFGQGFLSAEQKRDEFEDEELAVEDIDPYTLYIGNFPSDITVDEVKAMFHKAKKVEIGYAQKMKVSRYGFARYTNVDDAIEAYKTNVNTMYKSRSIIVRFRRNKRSIAFDGDCKVRKKKEQKQVEEISPNEEASILNGNESEEVEAEDTKSGVLDYARNLMENWLSDDMYESGNKEERTLLNLTGMIKHESEDDPDSDSLRSDDDVVERTDTDIQDINKEELNTVVQQKSPEKVRKTYGKSVQKSKIINNEKDLNKTQKNSVQYSNEPFREIDYWEEIRQKVLSEKDEKPDIQSLQLLSNPNPPITTYGLVPMILPKEEQIDDDDDNKSNENDDGSVDLENHIDQEDIAFENAWNELEASGI